MKERLFDTIDAAPPHAGALEELLGHLREDALPDAWLAQHAPDGRLEPAWNACANPRVLLRFLGREAEPEVLARALLALLSRVVPVGTGLVVPGGTNSPPSADALEVLGRFADGRGSRGELEQAFDALEASNPGGSDRALLEALNFVLDARERTREALLASLLRNLRLALEPDVEPAEDVPSEVVLELAEVIRAAVPCPSLHALIQKYCPEP